MTTEQAIRESKILDAIAFVALLIAAMFGAIIISAITYLAAVSGGAALGAVWFVISAALIGLPIAALAREAF